jgi:hypothetical protein
MQPRTYFYSENANDRAGISGKKTKTAKSVNGIFEIGAGLTFSFFSGILEHYIFIIF